MMRHFPRAAVVLTALAIAFPLWAGQQQIQSAVKSTVTRNLVRGGVGRSLSIIHGSAVRSDRSPLPNARVQLRNLSSGRIEDITMTNHVGEFSFVADPGSSYVVELADDAGRILAAGGILTAQGGETLGALVMLPTRLPTLAGLFGNSAGAIVSAAAGTGITAVTSTSPPASPEQ